MFVSLLTDLFHIYHDRDFFSYQINITRDEESTGEQGQKYTLYVRPWQNTHRKTNTLWL